MTSHPKDDDRNETVLIKIGDLVRWHKESGLPGTGLVVAVHVSPFIDGAAIHFEILWGNGKRWSVASSMVERIDEPPCEE